MSEIVRVRPGEKIPVDGIVGSGASAVDQAPITGESIPVEKTSGTEVYAGTLNGRGSLDTRVTKTANDTTIARIIQLVDEARRKKGGQLYRHTRPEDRLRALALGLVTGGAMGNLVNRVWSARGVVDFIDVGVGEWRWPTFNVADIGVSIGAILLAWVLWGEDRLRTAPSTSTAKERS